MQPQPSVPYQYGASTNPNALSGNTGQVKPLPPLNPMELKLNGDSGNVSYSSTSTESFLPSQYPSGQATAYSSMSSFSSTPGFSTLSSVPLNNSYQQNNAFTSVSSSYNYSKSDGGNTGVETSGVSNNAQPPIGTQSSNVGQNQFIPASSNTIKALPTNQNTKPPDSLTNTFLDQGEQISHLTNGSQLSETSHATSVQQTQKVSSKTFPTPVYQQPLTSLGSSVQQSHPSAYIPFSSTRSTNFQSSTASIAFHQQSISTSSYQQPSVSTPNDQHQNLSSPNNPMQPPTSRSQALPVSSGYNAQKTVASPVIQPLSAARNSFQPPTAVSSDFSPSANIAQPSVVRPSIALVNPSYGQKSMVSAVMQPTSAARNSFQPPTAVSSGFSPSANFVQPSGVRPSIAPVNPSYGQQPVASAVMEPPPVASNSFQPPTAELSGFPSSANITQQPLAVRPPAANVSTSYPQHASNILRPPVSTNSFQAPASNMPPPVAQFQSMQKPRPAYPQQNFRMPPNAFNTQTNKSVPLSNGIPPLSNNYQHLNSQYNPSFIQPSSNVYNNQVPPSYNGMPPAKHPGYPSNNIVTQPTPTGYPQSLDSQFSNLSVNQGMNKMWGYEPHDLLNTRDILPSSKVEPPPIRLPQNLPDTMNCSQDLFRCTLTKIPESKSLLDKSRLPLGLLMHPFKDINNLKVIKNMIVRCRQCRTYINPFVQFLDSKQWKCNICFRTNEIHEQFLYDRNTEMFGDPYRRPEIQSATVEYLATSDYTVRDPPQPAMYLFLLDVSQIAAQSGYLYTVCEVLLKQLKSMPGDLRTSVAVITYDSAVHFYNLAEGQTQPSQMILTDIEDIFLPSPENILVNLKECYDMIVDLLKQLPEKFKDSLDSGSALGPALQAAFKLLQPTGGRITIFQTCLPNSGPGALEARENPNQRSNDEPLHMNPATDFYKKIALECTSFYIAVDLFILNSQYVDLATLSGVSKFSSGCIHHIPLYNGKNMSHVTQLERMFSRYLTRKIGFESVMRIRCTKGLSIHTFHGNFFVRSTDLLALPNVNPDAGYGIQISIDESLTHIQYACFQVAVLYTSSKGDRRIRVHTLCLPVCSNVNDILIGADQQCIAGLLAKMAVDRSLQHSLTDAREAFLNVVCDVLSTYKITQSGHQTGSLLAPSSLKLLPLYTLALLKHPAFRIGQSTRLDDRMFAMTEMKCLPLSSLMLSIYPELYPIHTLDTDPTFEWNELDVPIPRILQLSAERLNATGTYLLNLPELIIILVRHGTSPALCSGMFGFQSVAQMPETLYELPQLETELSLRLHSLISFLNDDKAYVSPVKVMKDSSADRMEFYDKLIEDKNGGGMSYYEFLQRIREQVKSF